MAGKGSAGSYRDKLALVVIDVQQGFDHPKWGSRNNPDEEDVIAGLIASWRAADHPVIHIHHDSVEPDSPLRPGQDGNRPKPETAPLPGEAVYRKQVNSGFIGTTLEEDLRAGGAEALVLVGLTTNHCVSTTARMAGNLGFRAYVVSDATATFDRAALDGTMRLAADVHAAALSDLHGEFAMVVDAAAALGLLESW